MNSLVRLTTKELGAYYTPQTIADVLAEWVVQTGRETVLEPSIGDGALLRASIACAKRRLPALSNLRLVGCDVDDDAIDRVRNWLPPCHLLLLRDFLEVSPSAIGPVQGVISNPPFTRNHALPAKRRQELRQRFAIKGAAGLWVHFLFHAMDFLSPGGRLAAVVPAAAVFTSYGREALKRICDNFSHVEIRQIVDQPLWSSRADERGAIVLASNFGAGSCELPSASRWSTAGDRRLDRGYHESPLSFHQALAKAKRLSELATLSIGAVTGFNKIFLMSEAERVETGIEVEDLNVVVPKSRHLKGISVSVEEVMAFSQTREQIWMLTPRDITKLRRGIRNRLSQISKQKRRSVVWLNKRSPWWKIEIGPECDAIFTYMNDRGPRIVLTGQGLRCTNTLHRIRFFSEVDHNNRLAAALSMISSFGQLAAELTGRPYGGGVLKFELTDARRLPVLGSEGRSAKSAFDEADRAMRVGDTDRARQVADSFLLPPVFGPMWERAGAEMIHEAVQLRTLRRGNKS
ncbi:N-6 DNA methylase [Boseaceae bacterium BT-24-1]|nr:N-6 DNA methylase [Boseaceae bacterium BT-24-1]